ncbi:hypothetical protein OPW41_08820 [Vibrio europaeus]|uniref:hypothetical protein n=1 Tax=Vibrio europaeus TaxID=300876 RepID=UPI00233E8C0A|nr:hypothetical protein [Vibrio europaeus]MDC5755209.1 hypothetical protein [Vibrio europaeus]MDC5775788.1 hypothetical protein [Vibrio europaeus]MDC5794926.1 hypothetical protein [Vibrio europaeus]MDC5799497.1 hypothetical protein [Vibrio europaeus]MDC5817205.1 hypothetical protein [Vibrio europaeus]
MSLTNTQLRKAVSDVKASLAFLSKSQMKLVLTEVQAQLFDGKSPKAHTKRRISKLQQDAALVDFIVGLPLERINQIDCIRACEEKFGSERAPKRTAVQRQWAWLKERRRDRYGKY